MQDEQSPARGPDQALNPGSESAAPDVAVSQTDPVTDLTARLAAAEVQVREQQDAFLRAKAETENVRKRAAADLQQARKYALESFAAELIAVKDSLEAALGVQTGDVAAYRSGVELTLRQLASVLEKFHVVAIDPQGERFDPNRHQAISLLESDEPHNTVLTVMQKGYALHDRVLRPAFVTVAKPREDATG